LAKPRTTLQNYIRQIRKYRTGEKMVRTSDTAILRVSSIAMPSMRWEAKKFDVYFYRHDGDARNASRVYVCRLKLLGTILWFFAPPWRRVVRSTPSRQISPGF